MEQSRHQRGSPSAVGASPKSAAQPAAGMAPQPRRSRSRSRSRGRIPGDPQSGTGHLPEPQQSQGSQQPQSGVASISFLQLAQVVGRIANREAQGLGPDQIRIEGTVNSNNHGPPGGAATLAQSSGPAENDGGLSPQGDDGLDLVLSDNQFGLGQDQPHSTQD